MTIHAKRLITIWALAFLAVFVAAAPMEARAETCSEPVETREGPVTGKEDAEYASCEWRGIPFASAPIGDLRWKRPVPPEARTGVLEAVSNGPSCLQPDMGPVVGASEALSEDCLYLNVFSPEKSGNFPVMFWIHGGGFTMGEGSNDMYDGSRLASEQDVVVVSINYRLGALGFFSLPELAQEDPDGSTGNYGLMDQVRALEWVRDNIEAFGGDPDNVTIFGQSAGGMSVCMLIASPPAGGLFHRAIPMSGRGCVIQTKTEDLYGKSRDVASGLGCKGADTVECLRKLPAEKIVPGGLLRSAGGGSLFAAPVVDGYVLPDDPAKMMEEGNYNQVPVMVGSTKDEVRMFTSFIPGLSYMPRFIAKGIIKRTYGERAQEVISMYSWSDYDGR